VSRGGLRLPYVIIAVLLPDPAMHRCSSGSSVGPCGPAGRSQAVRGPVDRGDHLAVGGPGGEFVVAVDFIKTNTHKGYYVAR
jgi:hypothetical protein